MKETIIKNNFINYKNMTKEDYKELTQEDGVFFFDTESCPDFPKDIVEKYNLEEIEYNTIPEFETITEGSILQTLKQNKELKAKVYIWMLGNNNTDKVYWGNTIEEFMNFIEDIDTYKVKNKMKVETFNIYTHNLAWDMEFVKYWLRDKEYTQIVSGHNIIERKRTEKQEKAFDIVENEGQTHNARIQMEKRKVGNKNIMTTILFIDSLKITPLSLYKISKDLIKVDDMFIKDKDEYKYNIVRNPQTYIPTIEESWYQYKDIYILKEWYNQFIIPNYIEEGVKPYTISQIAFESIINKSFKREKEEGIYDHLMDKKGNIKDRDIYEEHYALKIISKNPLHQEYIRNSYRGGITTVGQKYKEIAQDNNSVIKGISIDITSSYPSQIVNKPLPFGIPSELKEGKYKDSTSFGKVFNYHFITIGFDGWHSKNKENQFGLPIKIHKLTPREKEQLKWTPNEIYTTNCIGMKYVGENRQEIKDKRRKEKIDALPYRYIITLPHFEYETLTKLFTFVHFENGERKRGVHFIDYISFQSEIGYMKEGIEYYYNQKEEGTKEGNKAKTYNAKVIINSFYGKNCSKRERNQRFYNFKKEVITFQPITEENRNEWLDDKLYAVQYGAAITSWGRIQLMETIYKIGSEKFIYADTDSLKIEGITKEELIRICKEQNIELSTSKEEKKLGGWDYEYSFSNFKAIAQKKYIYQIEGEKDYKCKCSGLPEEIRKEIKTKEQFNIGSTFTRNSKNKIIGGYLLLPTDFTITDLTIL